MRLLTAEEVCQLPEPPYLVEGVVVEGSFAAVYGKPASFKTFEALDIAFCVATGVSWNGRAVRAGTVVYLAAEGSGGLKRRMQAWQRFRGVVVTNCHFVIQPVVFLDAGQVTDLLEALQALPRSPVLIVIDTLARSFGTGDENATQDMSRFVAAVDRVRDAIGCTVLAVHHTPHKGGKLRGSSALPGALDTIIAVEREERRVVLRCEKMKDGPEFDPVRLEATPVALPDGTTSLVLVPGGEAQCQLVPETVDADLVPEVNERERTLLEQLALFGPEGASATAWQEAGAAVGVPRASFFRARKDLLADGRVEQFHAAGRSLYRATDAAPLSVPSSPDPD